MIDFLQLLVFLIAAVNPAAAAAAVEPAGKRIAPNVLGVGVLIAVALCVFAAIAAEQILDGLGVEPETFRVGAGVVMAVTGCLGLWNGGAPHRGPWEGNGAALFPLALPVLMTPAALAASISYGADEGAFETSVAVACAIGVAGLLIAARVGRYQAALDGVARATGALLIVVAGGLIVEGVRAI